jgi:hypothetical protein
MINKMVCILDPLGRLKGGYETVADVGAGDGVQDLQRLDRLESLFESIRSGPIQAVDDLVREIRTTHQKDLAPVGPWEGTDGMFFLNW